MQSREATDVKCNLFQANLITEKYYVTGYRNMHHLHFIQAGVFIFFNPEIMYKKKSKETLSPAMETYNKMRTTMQCYDCRAFQLEAGTGNQRENSSSTMTADPSRVINFTLSS